ncbi:Apolipoprotein N-acyltransferase / Copper homeostasis protein CutE [hydrothermal vent metagenome]|uniref:Apolipoprotein N-acyltransferase / Copper homeostasis protein CutE n=1 Tax=hydrothermal vent metagenome TaxID=652676 RepID=A0A3B1DQ31_9ZZZZ
MPKTSSSLSPVISPMSSTSTKPVSTSNDPTISMIIAQARKATVPARGGLLMGMLSAVLLWAAFTPVDFGAIAWVALIPLIQLVRIKQPTRWMYRVTYFAGLCFFIPTLQWMRLGHVTMYMAWGALAVYLACYFPLFLLLSRVAVQKFRVPLVVAVPVVWVGLEYARAHFLTGFSWYYLGHTQYRWIEMIQISDLVGAYGVSFVVAMTSAMLAGLVPVSWLSKFKLLPEKNQKSNFQELIATETSFRQTVTVVAALAFFAMVLGYGYYRRANVTFEQGPRVALIQGNFPTEIKHDPKEIERTYRTHIYLTRLAKQNANLDLIIWPETMFQYPFMNASPDLSQKELQEIAPYIPPQLWRDPGVRKTLNELSVTTGASLLIGIETVVAKKNELQRYNSALFVKPNEGIESRYDKIHRVVFGEYIPLKKHIPFLQRLTPYGSGFGITEGEGSVVMKDRNWRYTPVICFEDTVPHLVREIVQSTKDENGKTVDCLINISNDGWFHGSSELDQHLITSAFRAVECRTPMLRAVNTGISAVIDGDGVIREPEQFIDGDARKQRDNEKEVRRTLYHRNGKRWHKSLNAAIVDTVPLDNRSSLYVAGGDWFAGSCGTACLFFFVGLFWRRKNNTPTVGALKP